MDTSSDTYTVEELVEIEETVHTHIEHMRGKFSSAWADLGTETSPQREMDRHMEQSVQYHTSTQGRTPERLREALLDPTLSEEAKADLLEERNRLYETLYNLKRSTQQVQDQAEYAASVQDDKVSKLKEDIEDSEMSAKRKNDELIKQRLLIYSKDMDLKALQQQLNEANETINRQGQYIERLKQEFQDELEDHARQDALHKRMLEDRGKEMNRLEQQIESLQASLTEEQTNCKHQTYLAEAAARKLAQLESQLKGFEGVRAAFNMEKEDGAKKDEILMTTKTTYETTIMELKAELDAVLEVNQFLSQKVSGEEQQGRDAACLLGIVEAQTRELAHLRSLHSDKSDAATSEASDRTPPADSIQQDKAQRDELQSQLQSKQEELQALGQQMQGLESSRNEHRQQAAELGAELKRLQERVMELETEIRSLNSQKHLWQSTGQELAASTIQTERAQTQNQLLAAEAHLGEYRVLLQGKDEEKRSILAKLEQSSQLVDRLQSRIESLEVLLAATDAKAQEAGRLSGVLEVTEQHMAGLRPLQGALLARDTELAALKENQTERAAEIQRLITEIQKLRSEGEQRQDPMELLLNDLARLQGVVDAERERTAIVEDYNRTLTGLVDQARNNAREQELAHARAMEVSKQSFRQTTEKQKLALENLQQQLKVKDEARGIMEVRVRDLEVEVQTLLHKINSLQENLTTTKATESTYKEQILKVTYQWEQSQRMCEERQRQVNALSATLEDLGGNQRDTLIELSQLRADVMGRDTALCHAKEELERQSLVLKSHEEALESMRGQLAAAENALETEKTRNSELSQKVQSLTLADKAKTDELSSLQAQLGEHEKKGRRAVGDAETARARIAGLEAELILQQEETKKLEAALRDGEQEKTRVSMMHKHASQEGETLKQRLSTLTQQVGDKDGCARELARLQGVIKTMDEQLQTLLPLEQELRQKEVEVARAVAREEEKAAEAIRFKEELKRLQEGHQKNQQERSAVSVEVLKLQGIVQAGKEHNTYLQSEVERLVKALADQTNSHSEQLREKSDRHEKSVAKIYAEHKDASQALKDNLQEYQRKLTILEEEKRTHTVQITDIKTKLRIAEATVKEKGEALSRFQTEMVQRKGEEDKRDGQAREYEAESSRLLALSGNLQEQVLNLTKRMEETRSEHRRTEDELQCFRAELSMKEQAIGQLSHVLDEQRHTTAEKEEAMKAMAKTIESMQEAASQDQSKLRDMVREIATLTAKNEDMVHQNESLKAELNMSMTDSQVGTMQVDTLKATINQLERKAAKLQEEVGQHALKQIELSNQNDTLQSLSDEKEGDLHNLKAELDEVKRDLESKSGLALELARLQGSVGANEERLKNLQILEVKVGQQSVELANLTQQFQEKAEEADELQRANEELRVSGSKASESLLNANTEVARLEGLVESHERHTAAVQDQVDRLTELLKSERQVHSDRMANEKKKADEVCEELKDDIQARDQELDALRKQILSIETESRDYVNAIASLEGKLVVAQNNLVEKEEELIVSQEAVRVQSQRVEEIERQLEDASVEHEALVNSKAELEATIQKLSNELASSHKNLETALAEMDTHRQEFDAQIRNHEQGKAELTKTSKELMVNLEKQGQEVVELSSANQALKETVATLQESVATAEAEAASREKAFGGLMQAMTAIEADKDKSSEECKLLEEKNSELRQKVAELETRNRTLESEASIGKVTLEELERVLQERGEEIEASEKARVELQKEWEELGRKIASLEGTLEAKEQMLQHLQPLDALLREREVELAKVQEREEESRAELESISKSHATLQIQLEDREQKNQGLTAEVARLEGALEVKASREEVLESQIQALKLSLKSEVAGLEERLRSHEAEVKKEKLQMQQNADELVREKEMKLTVIRTQLENKVNTLEQYEREITQLNTQVEGSRSTSTEYAEQIQRVTEELGEAKSREQQKQDEVRKLQDQKASLQTLCDGLQEQISLLNVRLEESSTEAQRRRDAERDADQAHRDIQDMQKEILQLQDECRRSQQDLERKQISLDQCKTQHKEAEATIALEQEKTVKLEAQAQRMEVNMKDRTLALEKLRSELSKCEEKLRESVVELTHHKNQIEDLEQSLTAEKEKNANLQMSKQEKEQMQALQKTAQNVPRLQEQIAALNTRLQAAEKRALEAARLEGILQAKEQQWEHNQEVEENLRAKQVEAATYKQKVTEQFSEVNRLNDEVVQLRQQVHQKGLEVRDLMTRITRLESSLDAEKGTTSTLRSQLQSLTSLMQNDQGAAGLLYPPEGSPFSIEGSRVSQGLATKRLAHSPAISPRDADPSPSNSNASATSSRHASAKAVVDPASPPREGAAQLIDALLIPSPSKYSHAISVADPKSPPRQAEAKSIDAPQMEPGIESSRATPSKTTPSKYAHAMSQVNRNLPPGEAAAQFILAMNGEREADKRLSKYAHAIDQVDRDASPHEAAVQFIHWTEGQTHINANISKYAHAMSQVDRNLPLREAAAQFIQALHGQRDTPTSPSKYTHAMSVVDPELSPRAAATRFIAALGGEIDEQVYGSPAHLQASREALDMKTEELIACQKEIREHKLALQRKTEVIRKLMDEAERNETQLANLQATVKAEKGLREGGETDEEEVLTMVETLQTRIEEMRSPLKATSLQASSSIVDPSELDTLTESLTRVSSTLKSRVSQSPTSKSTSRGDQVHEDAIQTQLATLQEQLQTSEARAREAARLGGLLEIKEEQFKALKAELEHAHIQLAKANQEAAEVAIATDNYKKEIDKLQRASQLMTESDQSKAQLLTEVESLRRNEFEKTEEIQWLKDRLQTMSERSSTHSDAQTSQEALKAAAAAAETAHAAQLKADAMEVQLQKLTQKCQSSEHYVHLLQHQLEGLDRVLKQKQCLVDELYQYIDKLEHGQGERVSRFHQDMAKVFQTARDTQNSATEILGQLHAHILKDAESVQQASEYMHDDLSKITTSSSQQSSSTLREGHLYKQERKVVHIHRRVSSQLPPTQVHTQVVPAYMSGGDRSMHELQQKQAQVYHLEQENAALLRALEEERQIAKDTKRQMSGSIPTVIVSHPTSSLQTPTSASRASHPGTGISSCDLSAISGMENEIITKNDELERLRSQLQMMREFDTRRQDQICALVKDMNRLRQGIPTTGAVETGALSMELLNLQTLVEAERQHLSHLQHDLGSGNQIKKLLQDEEAARQSIATAMLRQLMVDVFKAFAGTAPLPSSSRPQRARNPGQPQHPRAMTPQTLDSGADIHKGKAPSYITAQSTPSSSVSRDILHDLALSPIKSSYGDSPNTSMDSIHSHGDSQPRPSSSKGVLRVFGLDARMLDDASGQRHNVLVINGVYPGSAAHKAGVQKSDIIVRWNHQLVYSKRQLEGLVQNSKADKIKLEVARGGRHIEMYMTL